MSDRDLLQQALDALHPQANRAFTEATRDALQAHLSQPEAEPVYWQWRRKNALWSTEYIFNSQVHATAPNSEVRGLYTAPPAPQAPVPLTDEQIVDMFREVFKAHADPMGKNNMTIAFARAIERAHGIGETK